MRKNVFLRAFASFLILQFNLLQAYPVYSQVVIENELPQGANVVAGAASFDSSANTLNITTSDRPIIEWNSFNIGQANTVNFIQPSAASVALNRVTGVDPSMIYGAMNANGQVFVVNPNGVYFGPGSRVDVNGLVASSLNISNGDFLAGGYNFTKDGNGAWVVNQGGIIANGGYVALLAGAVHNTGSILAPLGRVALAAGEQMTVGLDDASDISVTINEAVKNDVFGPDGQKMTDAIKNTGTITVDGGSISLNAKTLNGIFDNAINNAGVIQANTLVSHNGKIELIADGGTLRASNGSLTSAKASAADGQGGRILYYAYGDTIIENGAVIDVSGGTNSGDAGFIELSATDRFGLYSTTIYTNAAVGFNRGRIFIDPRDIIIVDLGADVPTGDNTSGTPDEASGDNVGVDLSIDPTALAALTAGEVYLQATRDIFVNSDLTLSTSLKLEAGNDINFNANVSAQNIYLTSGNLVTFSGNVNAAATVTVDAQGGVSQAAGSITAPQIALRGVGNFDLSSNGNQISSLAADIDGSLNFATTLGLGVWTVDGVTGIATNNHNVSLTSSNDIAVNLSINAGTADIALNAVSGIYSDITAFGPASITADTLSMTGTGDFRLLHDYLSVNTLSANTTGRFGYTYVNDVTVDQALVDSMGAIALTSSGVYLQATRDIFINSDITMSNVLDLEAGNDINVSANIVTTDNDITLLAGNAINLAGNLNAGTAVVRLDAAAGVNQASGAVTAAGLVLTGTGAFSLTSASNDVDTINANINGALTYTDVDALDNSYIDGVASGITTSNDDVTINTGDTFTIDYGITAGTGTVTLNSSNGVEQAGGVITADTLHLLGDGNFNFPDANFVRTLVNDIDVTGTLTYSAADDLLLDPIAIGLLGPGEVYFSAVRDIYLNDLLTMSNALRLEAGRDITFNNSLNTSDHDITLTAGRMIQFVSGGLNAGTGVITLDAGSNIIQNSDPGTSITASRLSVTNAYSVSLIGDSSNLVGSLDANVTGYFYYTDSGATQINSNGITATGGDLIITTGGLLTVNGDLNTPYYVVLISQGGVTQGSSSIAGNRLYLNGLGDFDLSSATNNTDGLAANITGSLNYRTSGDLSVSQYASDFYGIVTNDYDVSLTSGGALSIGQDLNAGTGNVALSAIGAITDWNSLKTITGNIVSLTVDNQGAATGIGSLGNEVKITANQIDAVVNGAGTGDMNLQGVGSMNLNSLSTNNGSITVTGDGAITATNVTTVSVDNPGGSNISISANGGALDVATINGGASSTISLSASESILDSTGTSVVNGGTIALVAGTGVGDITYGLHVNAVSGGVSLSYSGAGGNAHLIGDTDLNIGTINVGTSYAYLSANNGSINDLSGGSLITAEQLTLTSTNGIGSAAHAINTDTNAIYSNVTATGDTYIHDIGNTDVDALTNDGSLSVISDWKLTVTAANATGGNIYLYGGDAIDLIGAVSATGNVTLETSATPVHGWQGGQIVDVNGDGLISGDLVSLTSLHGMGDVTHSLNITANGIDTATYSTGDIYLTNSGDMTLHNATAYFGNINATSGGILTATNVDTTVGVAGDINLSGASGIRVGTINSAWGANLTSANGAITDPNGLSSITTAGSMSMTAATGIGDSTYSINNGFGYYSATLTQAGDVYIHSTADAVLSVTTQDRSNITITGDGTMTVDGVTMVDADGLSSAYFTSAGNMLVGAINVGVASLVLTSTNGSIGDSDSAIIGSVVNLSSGGDIGNGAPLNITADTLDAQVLSNSGSIYLHLLNGTLLNNIIARDGSINIAADESLTVRNLALTWSDEIDTSREISLTASNGDIYIDGPGIDATGANVFLTGSNGGVYQNQGSILAGGLYLSGVGLFNLDQASNDVDTIAASIDGSLIFTDMDDLAVGIVNGVPGIETTGDSVAFSPDVTLNTSGALTLNEAITVAASATVTLNSANGVEQTNGIITADTLHLLGTGTFNFPNVNAAGTLINDITGTLYYSMGDLTLDPVAIGLLGPGEVYLTAVRDIYLNDLLTISNALRLEAGRDININNNITTTNNNISLTAGRAINLAGDLDAGTGVVTLNAATDGVNQTAGIVTADTLELSGDGIFSLSNANAVTTLVNNISGTLIYTTGVDLTLDVVAIGLLGSGEVYLTAARDIFLNDLLTISNALRLEAGRDININNNITTTDNDITLTAGRTINLNGNLNAGTGVVKLNAAEGVPDQNGGNSSITASGLLLTGAGPFVLQGLNNVDVIAASIDSSLYYLDADGITVGTVGGVSGITTNGHDLDFNAYQAITLEQNIDVGAGTAILNVINAGGVNQTAGTIYASGLYLMGYGDFNFALGYNYADTLAANISGALNYTAGDVLTVGTVSGMHGITTGGHDLALNTLDTLILDGDINVGGGDANLKAYIWGAGIYDEHQGINQISGSITASKLSLTGWGNFDLLGANHVDTLAAIVVRGDLNYINSDSLAIGAAGDLEGIELFNRDVTVTAGGALTLNAGINAGTGTIALDGANGISQIDGVISASDLSLRANGAVDLSADNNVEGLSFAVYGDVTYNNTGDLSINADPTDGYSYSGGGKIDITTGGKLTLNSDVDTWDVLPANVTFNAANGVEEINGGVYASGLSLRGSGTFNLTGNNYIDLISADINGALIFKNAGAWYNNNGALSINTVEGISGVVTHDHDVTLTTGAAVSFPKSVTSGTGKVRINGVQTWPIIAPVVVAQPELVVSVSQVAASIVQAIAPKTNSYNFNSFSSVSDPIFTPDSSFITAPSFMGVSSPSVGSAPTTSSSVDVAPAAADVAKPSSRDTSASSTSSQPRNSTVTKSGPGPAASAKDEKASSNDSSATSDEKKKERASAVATANAVQATVTSNVIGNLITSKLDLSGSDPKKKKDGASQNDAPQPNGAAPAPSNTIPIGGHAIF